jgi:hypothetical protein
MRQVNDRQPRRTGPLFNPLSRVPHGVPERASPTLLPRSSLAPAREERDWNVMGRREEAIAKTPGSSATTRKDSELTPPEEGAAAVCEVVVAESQSDRRSALSRRRRKKRRPCPLLPTSGFNRGSSVPCGTPSGRSTSLPTSREDEKREKRRERELRSAFRRSCDLIPKESGLYS